MNLPSLWSTDPAVEAGSGRLPTVFHSDETAIIPMETACPVSAWWVSALDSAATRDG